LNLLANVLAREDARAAKVFEAVLVRDGHVTEGAISNVFAVMRGTVTTSPTDPSILPGITRAATLDLVRAEGLPLAQRAFSVDELRTADEIFLTGTTIEILPVVSLDGVKIGNGQPGPVTRRLAQRFVAMVERECGARDVARRPSARRRRRPG
jgi:D-alanine transaminase